MVTQYANNEPPTSQNRSITTEQIKSKEPTCLMNHNREAAEATANNDRHPETIKGYQGRINSMRRYAQQQGNWDESIFDNPPLPDEFIKEFMGFQSQANDDGSIKTASTIRKNVSALRWWYSTQDPPITVSKELDGFLTRFNRGHKRRIANLKSTGVMDQHEGKVGYSFTTFVFLAKLFMQKCGSTTTYAHLFFVLSWNLIARAVTVASMKYEFIHMDNDMIVVLPPKNKTDQTGERVEGKHIAANPFNPVICPVLALARHVFSDGNRTEYSSIFTRDAYHRFGEFFYAIVRSDDVKDHLEVNGNKLGKHSGRKAGATYCSSFPGGPGRDAVCQRADWSLGPIRDRYISAINNGNDQFVARVMSGLDIQSPTFATLPPHFSLEDAPSIASILHRSIDVNAYPKPFQGCLPCLLASIAYHYQYLDTTLDQHDRLKSSRLWTSGILPELQTKVILSNGLCNSTGMTATGVPPHICQVVATEKVEAELVHQGNAIRGDIAEVPSKLCNTLLEQFQVNGAIPITTTKMEQMLQTMREQLLSEMHNVAHEGHNEQQHQPARMCAREQWFTWYHPRRGRFFNVPPNFEFPRALTMKPCWDLYLHGNRVFHIRPFHMLESDDMSTHSDRCRLSNMKVVCRFILKQHSAGTSDNDCNRTLKESELSRTGTENTDEIFAKAWPVVAAKISDNESRRIKIRGDLVMTTVYNLIRKHLRGSTFDVHNHQPNHN